MATIKEVKEIPLKDLVIGKGQVRLRDVKKEVTELADSIRKVGLLEPIVVCPAEKPGQVVGHQPAEPQPVVGRDVLLDRLPVHPPVAVQVAPPTPLLPTHH